MKKLSESIFNAGIKRNQGKGERMEDKFHLNIDELGCGPFLGGVYWATDSLSIDDEYAIPIETFKKIKSSQLKGWRLPSLKEFRQMISDGYIYSQSAFDAFVYEKPGKEGKCLSISETEHMQIQPEGDINTVYYDFNGAIRDEHIDEDLDGGGDYVIIVQLVRDNKI